jgi:O-antigen/teichoic acid export membrane protein/glycosyltransferase involved in cell wall biosynthesis
MKLKSHFVSFLSSNALQERDAAGVRQLAIRGAGATMLSGGVAIGVQIVGILVLARLLVPADFGVVTMVTTFSLLLSNFGVNGFTEAIIQREEVDHTLASNIFWISLGAGLLLAVAFGASGHLVGRFYHDSKVPGIVIGMSVANFITSASVVHLALLKRAMRFSETSANEVCGRAVALIGSILLAWAGLGYWALVAGAIILALSVTIGGWYLCRWVPSLPRRHAGTASMLRFALHVYGRFGLNYFSRNTDNLLVGWRFGAVALGFYKKAYDLFALSASQSVSPLTNVAVSALSRFDPKSSEYRRNLLHVVAMVAFCAMGISAALTLIGKDLIRLLLGPGWEPAGHIFTYFGPGIGVMLLYYTHGWIHLSIGRADRWFRWAIVEFSVTTLLFCVALHWGPVGVATAWTASFWILTLPAFSYAGKPVGIGGRNIATAIWMYVVAALIAACACAALRTKVVFGSPSTTMGAFEVVVGTSVCFVFLYFGTVALLYRGFAPLFQLAGIMADMVPWFKIPSISAPEPAGTDGPLVSILIPAYNAEKWIADTVRSALAQSWAAKEIIVVDDGSSDETVAIARQFEADGVRVVCQQNEGAAAARNLAFSLSRGKYIQWLDADDLLAPDKIEKQMQVALLCRDSHLLLSGAWGKFMYRHYRAEFTPTALWCNLSPVEWLLRKMGQNLYMQTATWLVSRELTEAAGAWDTRLLSDDDGEYFSRVIMASSGIIFVPESTVFYRGPGLAFNGLSHIGRSSRKIEAHWLSMQLHIGYLRSLEESRRVNDACLNYLQTSLLCFYPEKTDIVTQAEQLADELGGRLATPCLSWKYLWLKQMFGWRLAKMGQQVLLRIRWSVERFWEEVLFRVETGTVDMARESYRNSRWPTGSPAEKEPAPASGSS